MVLAFTAIAAADKTAPAEDTGSAAAEPQLPHITGPKLVDLGNQSEIDLPDGMVMYEREVAQKLLREEGSRADNVVAALFRPDQEWGVVIEYEDSGYINDSDANELDGDKLQAFREGTAEQNATRRQLGKPELFVDAWSEPPRYEVAKHHLVWGLKLHDSTNEPIINFFTRVLGRTGYLSINLIAAPDKIEQAKVQALAVLTSTRFKPGARYEDHKSGDKDSGIGLTALVLGGAGLAVAKAAKAGIIIKILLVLKKGIIVIVAAIVRAAATRRAARYSGGSGVNSSSVAVGAPFASSPLAIRT